MFHRSHVLRASWHSWVAMYPIKAHHGIFHRSGNGPFFLHSWCNMARQMSAKLPWRRGDWSWQSHGPPTCVGNGSYGGTRIRKLWFYQWSWRERIQDIARRSHTISLYNIYIYIYERVYIYICFPVYTPTYLGYSYQLTMIPAGSHFNSQPTLHIHPSLEEAFLLILSPSLGSLMHS